MKTLDRYIARNMALSITMTVLVLVILLVFINLVEELDQVGRADYQLRDAFTVAFLSAPRYLFEVFPIAALLGSLLGLGGLASRSELIAMRAAGFSTSQIVSVVVKAGLLMMAIVFAFGELLAPSAEQYAQQLRFEKLQKQVVSNTRHGFWARDGRAFVNIRDVANGLRLHDIYIYEFDQQDRLKIATYAQYADYQEDHWILNDIAQSRFFEQKVESEQIAQARWDSLLDPGLLSLVVVKPTLLPIWELSQYIDFMRENGQSAIDYEVAYWLKLVNPLATLIMLLLAIPFVLGNQRSVSIGQRIFLGTLLGAGFFLLTRAMSYVAVVYPIHPAVTALAPSVGFAMLAILMLRSVR